MALRRFLFQSDEGYADTAASADETELGKLTLSGIAGISIDGGASRVANIAAPVDATDAAHKQFVENADAALKLAYEAADALLQAAITAEVNRATAEELDIRNDFAVADQLLQDQIDALEQTTSDDGLTYLKHDGSRAMTGTLDMGSLKIGNLADGALATDAVNKGQLDAAFDELTDAYEAADSALQTDYIARDVTVLNSAKSYADSLLSGFTIKAPAKAMSMSNIDLATGGAMIVDGVSLVAGDRVLLNGQTDGKENGVYVVAEGPWLRATDVDEPNEIADGLSVFVEQGTQYSDTTWVLVTNNPITLGTDALTFVQFAGQGTITAGAGLVKNGAAFDVNPGNGIAIESDEVAVSLASNPGLEFSGGMLKSKSDSMRGIGIDAQGLYLSLAAAAGMQFDGSGDLEAKLTSMGGLQKDADGLSVKLDGTTLQSDADGVSVKGLPSLFEIAGFAVGSSVDAEALTKLTDGSNADAYHTHEAIGSIATVEEQWMANGAIAKGDGVYVSEDNGVSKGDCTNDTKSRVIGVSNEAMADDAQGGVIVSGTVSGVLSGATAGNRYFLGSNGQPVLVGSLPAGARTIQLGIAKNATDLQVRIVDFGKKGA